MKQALFIEAEYNDDVMVIRPMGTFNCWQLPTINAIIGTYINSVETPQLIINLSHVKFVDSATLKQLSEWLTKAGSYGGDLKLCNVDFKMRTILNAQVGQDHFEIYASEAQALAAFQYQIQFSVTA